VSTCQEGDSSLNHIAYTDGACSASIGGWAYTLNDERSSGWLVGATNNQMELYAIYMVIEAADCDSTIDLHTDSKLAIGWLVHDWARSNPVIDQLVWAIWLASDVKQVRVRYHKVKGHSDSEGNILVDYLAQVASRNGFYRCQELLK